MPRSSPSLSSSNSSGTGTVTRSRSRRNGTSSSGRARRPASAQLQHEVQELEGLASSPPPSSRSPRATPSPSPDDGAAAVRSPLAPTSFPPGTFTNEFLPANLPAEVRARCDAFVANPVVQRVDDGNGTSGCLCPVCGQLFRDNWIPRRVGGGLRRQVRTESLKEHLGMRHNLLRKIVCPVKAVTRCACRGYIKGHRLINHLSENCRCLAAAAVRLTENNVVSAIEWGLGSDWLAVAAADPPTTSLPALLWSRIVRVWKLPSLVALTPEFIEAKLGSFLDEMGIGGPVAATPANLDTPVAVAAPAAEPALAVPQPEPTLLSPEPWVDALHAAMAMVAAADAQAAVAAFNGHVATPEVAVHAPLGGHFNHSPSPLHVEYASSLDSPMAAMLPFGHASSPLTSSPMVTLSHNSVAVELWPLTPESMASWNAFADARTSWPASVPAAVSTASSFSTLPAFPFSPASHVDQQLSSSWPSTSVLQFDPSPFHSAPLISNMLATPTTSTLGMDAATSLPADLSEIYAELMQDIDASFILGASDRTTSSTSATGVTSPLQDGAIFPFDQL
ncbi:hypothetical protein H9P43_007166 [Blastocladiella emersonii ATCC 22665]|nr:hypothetical protein H9P43_007166 [Blastocladiella emersonii ATCC 22665]